MYTTSKEMILEARRGGYAVPAFNAENLEMVQAIIEAAEEARSPVMIQTTPSTVKYITLRQAVAMVKADAEAATVPVSLHLDHCESYEAVAAANDGDTIKLLADTELTAALTINKEITLIADEAVTITATEYTIGFDTACNTAIDCIDKLRDTMQSHERCSVVEVMGRHAGYLAMYVGLATGATAVLVPEHPISNEELIEKIRQARFNGFTHYMIVVAEGAGSANDIAAKIKDALDLDPRVTVLGHIQRGGTPSARDRVNATKMGYLAVELLRAGKTNRVVCTEGGRVTDIDINEGLEMRRQIQKIEVDVLAAMTGI